MEAVDLEVVDWAVADSEAVGWAVANWAEADLAVEARETAEALEAAYWAVQRGVAELGAEALAVETEGAAVLATVGSTASVARFRDRSDHTESRPVGSWCTHSKR